MCYFFATTAESTIHLVKMLFSETLQSVVRFRVVVYFLLLFPPAFLFVVLRAQEIKLGTKNYFVKLVCESADKIVTIRFDGANAKIVATADTRIASSWSRS